MMLGNAVPPKLEKVVGESISEMLAQVDKEKMKAATNRHVQLNLF
jgi:hypothetical protein